MAIPQTLSDLGGSAPAATAGQLYLAYETGGYAYADNLSDLMRVEVSKRCRFRQFCELPEGKFAGTGNGGTFHWTIYGNIDDSAGGELAETDTIPTTRMLMSQGSVSVVEWGLAVPYSGKLEDLSYHDVASAIKHQLQGHATRKFDLRAHLNFAKTPLKVLPGGIGFNDAATIQITEDGTPAGANDAALTAKHVKAMSREARERNIPTHEHGDYYMLARPATYETVEDNLENIQQYTPSGYQMIRNGEKGRYAGVRFVEQTNTPVASTAFANEASDEAFLFGHDCVIEASVVPEEIRIKIPDDYGRGKGIAYYAMLNFQIARASANDARILHWTSAAA